MLPVLQICKRGSQKAAKPNRSPAGLANRFVFLHAVITTYLLKRVAYSWLEVGEPLVWNPSLCFSSPVARHFLWEEFWKGVATATLCCYSSNNSSSSASSSRAKAKKSSCEGEVEGWSQKQEDSTSTASLPPLIPLIPAQLALATLGHVGHVTWVFIFFLMQEAFWLGLLLCCSPFLAGRQGRAAQQ